MAASTITEHQQQLAIHGGEKAFAGAEGKAIRKHGMEEFLAMAKRFAFKPEAIARMQEMFSDEDMDGHGPVFARYWSTFPKPSSCEGFEARARELFGSPYALGVSSGTAALHAAMVAVGAGPGKEVVVPSLGFMATAVAVALTGATPVFCDVDHSLQLDPDKLEACISENTVAVAPTHHWGVVADMDPIMAIATRHKIRVIEDCAQSPGATYKGRMVGTIGDIGCFSISAYKIIGGGEAGLLLCKDQRLFERANQLAECGGLWRENRFAVPRYEGELFVGTNYRMSELEAAIDRVQLDRLEGIVSRTRTSFHRVASQLLRCREIQPQKLNDAQGLVGYQLRFFPQSYELAGELSKAIRAEGVGCGYRGKDMKPDWHRSCDMYPLADHLKAHSNVDCPVGSDLYARELSIGIAQSWTAEDCDGVAAAINKVLRAMCTVDENAAAWM